VVRNQGGVPAAHVVDNVVGNQGGALAGHADDNPAALLPNGPMHWTPVHSRFMLRRFHDLVG